jgi:hypothetical protein
MPMSRKKRQQEVTKAGDKSLEAVIDEQGIELLPSVSMDPRQQRHGNAVQLADKMEEELFPKLAEPNLLFPVPVVASEFRVSERIAWDALEELTRRRILTRIMVAPPAPPADAVSQEHPFIINLVYKLIGTYQEAKAKAAEYVPDREPVHRHVTPEKF